MQAFYHPQRRVYETYSKQRFICISSPSFELPVDKIEPFFRTRGESRIRVTVRMVSISVVNMINPFAVLSH